MECLGDGLTLEGVKATYKLTEKNSPGPDIALKAITLFGVIILRLLLHLLRLGLVRLTSASES